MAFTNFFLKRANDAYTSLNTGLYSELVVPTCKTCSAMTDTIASYKSHNYKYVGDFVTPTFVTINTYNDQDISVLVVSDTKASKVYAPNGSVVQEVPAAKGNVAVELVWTNDAWRVSGIKGA